MDALLSTETLLRWVYASRDWLIANVLATDNLIQIGVLVAALLAGRPIGGRVSRFLGERWRKLSVHQAHLLRLVDAFLHELPMLAVLLLAWLSVLALQEYLNQTFVMNLALNLLGAWIVIRLATSAILDRFWSRLIATAAWTLAALNILGLLEPALSLLEGFGFTVGSVRLTVLSLIKAVVVLVVLMRLAGWVSGYMERRLREIPDISPSTHVLLTKAIKIGVFALVCVVGLTSVGIDLTALAVFSGAVGVGIGFGLQKVVGNLISGIILLMDRSIKPGDVIQIGDVYGWITELRGRYVSVSTRDGKELLIPNEDLITQQVVNWSFSSNNIRIRVPVGISYNDDPHRAMEIIVAAVEKIPRVLNDPAPKCLLTGFGDSSVDLELRFWIQDPQNGVANIRSTVLLKVWDALKAAGIEIPFPQRDVHLDLTGPVNVAGAGGKPAP
jgi:small-conductance mechanosensitive channel